MNRLFGTISRSTLSITLLLLMPGANAGEMQEAGHYCPPLKTYDRVAEEISISLDQVAKAQHAMLNGNAVAANVALGRAANALTLASTHGAAARTRRLIDAAVTAKDAEDYQKLLGWFPLLHSALLTLPDTPEVRSAGTELGLAEDILQGDNKGDALKHLHSAAHYLGCDKLDIPLQQADDALTPLLVQVAQGHKAKPATFDKVLVLLRTALNTVFEQAYSAGSP